MMKVEEDVCALESPDRLKGRAKRWRESNLPTDFRPFIPRYKQLIYNGFPGLHMGMHKKMCRLRPEHGAVDVTSWTKSNFPVPSRNRGYIITLRLSGGSP